MVTTNNPPSNSINNEYNSKKLTPKENTLPKNLNFSLLSLQQCYKMGQRMVVLDTETTGLDFTDGHRIIEIGCVELYNNRVTGKFFQSYLNPCREISQGAYRVTGLTREFLQDKPLFKEIAKDFMDFVKDSPLIIHNSAFDIPFINHELRLARLPELTQEVVDTLLIAREMFPGKPCNLDALCRRLNVDNSTRSFHGALLDSQILSKVYMSLLSMKKQQKTLDLFMEEQVDIQFEHSKIKINREMISKQLVNSEDCDLHQSFWQ